MTLASLLRGTSLLAALALFSTAQAQSLGADLWSDVSEASLSASLTANRSTSPAAYRTLQLDRAAMAALLAQAPLEAPGLPGAIDVPIPSPDGSLVWFRVSESPVLEPGIQARHPQIRTYVGQGRDVASATVRFSLTPAGFAATARTPQGTLHVDAYAQGDDAHYLSYFHRDLVMTDAQRAAISAEVVEDAATGDAGAAGPIDAPTGAARTENGTVLRTYRLALSATVEYSLAVCPGTSNTTECVLAAQVTAVNRVNEVYNDDVAVRMVIIDGNEPLIFTGTDTSADPFTNNSGGVLINENQTFVTQTIGTPNFDIGHVFSTGGGGIAGLGVVCSPGGKARGVTGLPNPVGDGFYIDYVAHEMGHQFRGNHTFNGTASSCGGGNRNASTAVEPGSGTTIMAYAGICGSHNTQGNSDPYFHAISLQEIVNFITNGGGSTCGTETETGNDIPVVTVPAGYVLPISTPFALTGVATDNTPDALTYTWEETDLGPGGAPAINGVPNGPPFFRSFTPTDSPTRFFPQYNRLRIGLNPVRGEALPNDTRTLAFRLTVRDNQANGGAIADGNTFVATDAGAGPFVVTSFDQGGVEVLGGSVQTLEWTVANTAVLGEDGQPDADNVDVENVEILYSIDDAETFETLVASTPNDGSEDIIIPNIATVTPLARLMVRAIDNVFFSLNDRAFNVTFNPDVANENTAQAAVGLSAVTPNPATGRASFTLRGAASGGSVSVAVYDALGRQVMRLHDGPVGDDQPFTVDVSRLPAGVYVVRASGGAVQATQRFTVVR